MVVTIVSVSLTTESGDDYLFTYDGVIDPEEFVELVEKDLGEELAYVCSTKVNVLYARQHQEEYEAALQQRIEEMGEYA